MEIYLLREIHNEFELFEPPPSVEVDAVILACDIHVKGRKIAWIESMLSRKRVLYAFGNHEYYGQAIPRETERLKERTKGTHIHVLENDLLRLGEYEVFGCTLWTDFRLLGNTVLAATEARERMTDHRKIRVSPSFRRLKPRDTNTFLLNLASGFRRQRQRAGAKRK